MTHSCLSAAQRACKIPLNTRFWALAVLTCHGALWHSLKVILNLLQEIMEVEQIMEEDQSLPLTDENVEKVLDEIRPYLVGMQHF